jgi:hypothetical protein
VCQAMRTVMTLRVGSRTLASATNKTPRTRSCWLMTGESSTLPFRCGHATTAKSTRTVGGQFDLPPFLSADRHHRGRHHQGTRRTKGQPTSAPSKGSCSCSTRVRRPWCCIPPPQSVAADAERCGGRAVNSLDVAVPCASPWGSAAVPRGGSLTDEGGRTCRACEPQ